MSQMMQTLKNRIVESSNPVGIKKVSNWNLPENNFAYGKKVPADPEGVDISNIKPNFHSYSKLACSYSVKKKNTSTRFRESQ